MTEARNRQTKQRRLERAEEHFLSAKKLSGIEELLRQWDWHLPPGYSPVRLEDCRRDNELVLIVQGGGKTLKLNRDGRLHTLHPKARGLSIEGDDDLLDTLVAPPIILNGDR